jgi:hypothetical protein
MVAKLTYQNLDIQCVKKSFIACLFLVFLGVNPIVQLASAVEDIKYELVDASEKEESSKQESISEMENDKLFFQVFDGFSFQNNPPKSSLFHEAHSSYLNYHKDIHLPPPRTFFTLLKTNSNILI